MLMGAGIENSFQPYKKQSDRAPKNRFFEEEETGA